MIRGFENSAVENTKSALVHVDSFVHSRRF
jgi:hypothetical protein